eukprot:s3697_g3.t1
MYWVENRNGEGQQGLAGRLAASASCGDLQATAIGTRDQRVLAVTQSHAAAINLHRRLEHFGVAAARVGWTLTAQEVVSQKIFEVMRSGREEDEEVVMRRMARLSRYSKAAKLFMMREILHGDVDQFGALEAWLKKQKVDNDAKKHLETQQKKREKEKSHEAKLAVHRKLLGDVSIPEKKCKGGKGSKGGGKNKGTVDEQKVSSSPVNETAPTEEDLGPERILRGRMLRQAQEIVNLNTSFGDIDLAAALGVDQFEEPDIHCPWCHVEYSDDSNFCGSCGKPRKALTCYNCEAHYVKGSLFCRTCGFPRQGLPPAGTPSPSPGGNAATPKDKLFGSPKDSDEDNLDWIFEDKLVKEAVEKEMAEQGVLLEGRADLPRGC